MLRPDNTLKDGRVVSGKVDQCFGRTSEVPLPPALLKDKFINCAIAVLPDAQAADLYQAIMTFEKAGDMRDLMALVAVPPRSSKRPAVAA